MDQHRTRKTSALSKNRSAWAASKRSKASIKQRPRDRLRRPAGWRPLGAGAPATGGPTSSRVVDVDEPVWNSEVSRQVCGHGRRAVPLARVVAAVDEADAGFAGVVGLRLGDLAGDEGIRARC